VINVQTSWKEVFLKPTLLFFFSLAASAQEYYLIPERFTLPRAGDVKVGVTVGFFPESEFIPAVELFDRAILNSANGATSIANFEKAGNKAVASVYVTAPGDYSIAMATQPAVLEMTANEFEKYLREEGLSGAIALRMLRGEGLFQTREVFTWCLKTMVRVGKSNGEFSNPAGLMLEFVPQSDPFAMRPGSKLPVQVMFGDDPGRGLQVIATSAKSSEPHNLGRTDDNGMITVPIDAAGPWLLHTVALDRLPDGIKMGNKPVEWQSFWATLTFEVPERN
jgi:uncharacterized GH25 family protein